MKILKDHKLNYFDSGFPSSSLSVLTGSNVYNLGGYSGAISRDNDIEAVSYDCDYFGQLTAAIARLSSYRNHDLVKTVLGLYADAVSTCVNFNSEDVIAIENETKLTAEVNDAFKKMEYLRVTKEDLQDFIFYGSVFHKADFRSDNKNFIINDLKYPYSTGYYRPTNKRVVISDNKPQYEDNLIGLSFDDLRVTIDEKMLVQLGLMTQDELNSYHRDKDKLYALPKLTCSYPLFLGTEMKLKNYILDDLISAFLAVINLIEQDTFTLDGSRISDMTNLIKLCNKIKGLLVTKDDMNLLAGARLDKTALIRRLFDRVRVIPSIGGAINNLQKLEGTNLKDKLDILNNQKETARADVLTAIGFPMDLFQGNTNKWEVGRQNDRYNIKVVNIKDAIKSSTINNTKTILKMMGANKEVQNLNIKCLFVQDSQYEIQNKIQKMNNNRDLMTAIQDILRTAVEISQQEGITDPKGLAELVNGTLKVIGVDASVELHDQVGNTQETDTGDSNENNIKMR